MVSPWAREHSGPWFRALPTQGLTGQAVIPSAGQGASRARTPPRPFQEFREVLPHLGELLDKTEAGARKVRLLGVSFTVAAETPEHTEGQLDLFAPD